MVDPKAFQDALLAYHARPCDSEAEAVRAAVLQEERERCARIADDEARIREEAGQKHAEGSMARDRCFAGARAAANVARGIRSGEIVAAVPVAQRALPHPIGAIFSDGYWNLNVMLRGVRDVDPYRRFHGGVDVYTEGQVRELLRNAGGRVLDAADPFCPKCGHNRDLSSVSSVDHGKGHQSCQQCGAEWTELAAGAKEVGHG